MTDFKTLEEVQAACERATGLADYLTRLTGAFGSDGSRAIYTLLSALTQSQARIAEQVDQRLELMAAFYRAWPHAEDMPDEWPHGFVANIDSLASERDAAQAQVAELEGALTYIVQDKTPMRFAEDDTTDYFLRWIKALKARAQAALLTPSDGESK